MRKYGMMSAVVLMLLAAFVFTGCQKPPEQEQGVAQQALEAAKQAEAEKYAQTELSAVQATLDQAKSEIETQKAKWFPKYEKAKELLAQAKTQADQAKEAAIANKEKAKNEATQAINDAKAALTAAKEALGKAPKGGKGTKVDIEQFTKDLDGYNTSITEAESMMQKEDFFGARDKAKQAMDGAKNVQTQLDEVIAKMAEKKAGHKGGKKK
jgi:hypothetical protein